MFWVSSKNLLALNVFEIVHKNFLREHVYQSLNVPSHDLLIISLNQLTEVTVGEGRHEELHVKLIPIHAKTGQNMLPIRVSHH